MFELAILIILIVVGNYVQSLWLGLLLFLVGFVLVLPGLYAMYFGAPFLISSKKRIEDMLEIGDFKAHDRVVDLGCGDGRILRMLRKKGVKNLTGYEFSLPTYLWAKFLSFYYHGSEKIYWRNFWRENLEGFNVLICFLLPKTMLDFERKIWPKLAKGTRVISNEFKMKNVRPSKTCGHVYLYIKTEREK